MSWILTVTTVDPGLQALWRDVRADKAMEMRKVRNQALEEKHFLKLKIDYFFLHRIVEMSVRSTFCSQTSLLSVPEVNITWFAVILNPKHL